MRLPLSLVLVLLLSFPEGGVSARASAQEPATAPQDTVAPPQDSAPPLPRRAAPLFPFGLEDATPVKLKTNRELSSATDRTGDQVDFEVTEDVMVKDLVVIPKGGIAWGKITDAKPKRRLGRAGKLDVTIEQVRLADGERVPLRAVREVQGKGRQGLMTGAMVATGILFFPAAPLFLFMHGKDISIPKGSDVTAYVNGDTPLEEARFNASATPHASPPSEAPQAPPAPAASPAPATRPSPNGSELDQPPPPKAFIFPLQPGSSPGRVSLPVV
ncbi:MAG TPA: PEGA domain-containing protein [Candidatus Sulfotelmatobacter sp.]|nr:PEGA domain-containing protein [Candidatus Sulfotelmatobacter sp.]